MVITELTSNPQFSSPLGLGVIKLVGSRNFAERASGGNGMLGEAGTGMRFSASNRVRVLNSDRIASSS